MLWAKTSRRLEGMGVCLGGVIANYKQSHGQRVGITKKEGQEQHGRATGYNCSIPKLFVNGSCHP